MGKCDRCGGDEYFSQSCIAGVYYAFVCNECMNEFERQYPRDLMLRFALNNFLMSKAKAITAEDIEDVAKLIEEGYIMRKEIFAFCEQFFQIKKSDSIVSNSVDNSQQNKFPGLSITYTKGEY